MASGGLQFRAFISYSHRDKRWAGWLHRALETYRVPRHLVGRETSAGLVGSRIGKIFRDRDELAVSADLSGEINEALKNTQFLVVLCSPASAKSQWVNQEIINFKRLKGDASIICVIADGEPYASLKPGMEDQECFAPALRYQVKADGTLSDIPAEPVAADLRPHADGKRRAKLKVIAGLLDVGLDELVQRENQRYRRRMAMLSAASIAGVITLSTLTYNAIVARDLAEQRLAQAEGFVEYMIGDLRENLEPIGRLDVLDSVSSTALDYYAAMNPDEMNVDSLARRSRAFHMLGEIQDLKGDLEAARTAFSEAKQTTEELLARDPNNTQRIYDHAQSVFWVGYSDWQRGQMALAEKYFLEYRDLAELLVELEPDKLTWQTEVGHANTNLGVVSLDEGSSLQALSYFKDAIVVFKEVASINPNHIDSSLNYTQSIAWAAETYRQLGDLPNAHSYRDQESKIYVKLLESFPGRTDIQRAALVSKTAVGRLLLDQGNITSAFQYFQNAVKQVNNLLNIEPNNIDWQELAATAYLNLGLSGMFDRDLKTARQSMEKARQISARLIELDSSVYRWKLELLFPSMIALAKLNFVQGELGPAKEILENLLNEIESNESTVDDEFVQNVIKAEAYLLLGDVASQTNSDKVSFELWETALRSLPKTVESAELSVLQTKSYLHEKLGESAIASEINKKLDRVGYNHPDRQRAEEYSYYLLPEHNSISAHD